MMETGSVVRLYDGQSLPPPFSLSVWPQESCHGPVSPETTLVQHQVGL